MADPAPSTLVIDCATEACSVALFASGELVGGEMRILGRGHAEALVPMIAALPGKGRASRIAVAIGPGSFTGVRVGLAAARALAFAWGAELVGYPTLALVAAQAGLVHPGQPIASAMTGGHGEWFVQQFTGDGAPMAALASLTPDRAAEQTTCTVVAGTQALALVALRGTGNALELWPDARSFSLLQNGLLIPNPAPLYGRAPDARLPGGLLPAATP
ncbi:MAG: tRNA (adenosine(37)-N6)-threonylcarbamoyltransferase complex dimerization subunit type 1 TsaB [Novosphingobium sp.]